MPAPSIAFLVLAHNDAPHLERLCKRLHPHSVFVHIDRKSNQFPTESIRALPNVTLARRFFDVHWGDFSMIEATLDLIRTAREKMHFDRYVLLSGSCYPAKPLKALEAAFSQNSEREWIALTPITRQTHLSSLIDRHWRMAPFVGSRKLDSQFRSIWNKVSKLMGRNLEREIGMKPYFGSQWWALTDECVSMILDFVDTHPSFVRAYKSVYAPDEHFFSTIVGNSSFNSSAIPVEDRGSATNQYAPLHLVSARNDRYFHSEEDDFVRVERTGQFFIRKVSTERSGALLDRIDRELLGALPVLE